MYLIISKDSDDWAYFRIKFLMKKGYKKCLTMMMIIIILIVLLALPTTKARILCLDFIIEYNSWRDFGPYVIIIGLFLFLYEDFWNMIFFWLVLKLEISYYYRVIIYLEGFWFLLEGFFFEDYIFAWWNIFWVFPQFFFCLKILFNVNGK
jgi:hypothetical protein